MSILFNVLGCPPFYSLSSSIWFLFHFVGPAPLPQARKQNGRQLRKAKTTGNRNKSAVRNVFVWRLGGSPSIWNDNLLPSILMPPFVYLNSLPFCLPRPLLVSPENKMEGSCGRWGPQKTDTKVTWGTRLPNGSGDLRLFEIAICCLPVCCLFPSIWCLFVFVLPYILLHSSSGPQTKWKAVAESEEREKQKQKCREKRVCPTAQGSSVFFFRQ